jgi:hypothetical protein
MEVRDDLGVATETFQERGRKVPRLQGREAETVEVGDAFAEGGDQGAERRVLSAGAGLASAEGGVVSVRAEEDAGEDEFVVAGGDEGAGFGDRVVEGFAPERGAELGDDAVGAVGVAAVLDLEEGALVGGLAGVELGKSGRAASERTVYGAGIRQIFVNRVTRILIMF